MLSHKIKIKIQKYKAQESYVPGLCIFTCEDSVIMYKDENAENQYIVQFNDSYPDKTFEVHFDSIILNSDKFGIGSEIAVRQNKEK